MRNLSLNLKYLLSVCLVVITSLVFMFFLVVRTDSLSASFATLIHLEVSNQQEARVLQVDFKKQVQEWKNILLRGHNPADNTKYTEKFFATEQLVADDTRNLIEASNDPAVIELLQSFQSTHATLGREYREALEILESASPPWVHAADAHVRGKDRPPTDLLDDVVEASSLGVEAILETKAADLRTENWIVGSSALLVFGVVGFLVSFTYRQWVVVPVTQLAAAAKSLAEGDLEMLVPEVIVAMRSDRWAER